MICLSLAYFALATATVSADALWDRAVELFRQFDDLTAGRIDSFSEQYNGRGDLVSTEEGEYAVWEDEDGKLETRIVRVIENGTDITEQRRNNPDSSGMQFGGNGGDDEDGEDNAFAGLQRSPFDPEEQGNVSITETRDVRLETGEPARRYDFVHTTGRDTRNVGVAWLHVETGEPVRLELTVEPLPPFVSEFSMLQRFGRDAQERWVLREMEFVGAGSFLFISRRVESRLVFSEYFRSETG